METLKEKKKKARNLHCQIKKGKCIVMKIVLCICATYTVRLENVCVSASSSTWQV